METLWFFRLRFRRAYDSAYDSDFRFSPGHKLSYDSDYDSDPDSVASENQPLVQTDITATFNNMRILKFKAQPTNAFSATANQMFGGSSQLRLHSSTEHFVVWALLNDLISARSAVVGGWEEPPKIWLAVAKKRICRLSFEL